MRRLSILAISTATLLSCAIYADTASAQFGSGRGVSDDMRARMSAMTALPLETMWAVLTLDMDLREDQIAKLRPGMRTAWKEREEILNFARERDAWEMAGDKLKELRKRLDAQVAAHLEKAERKAYEARVEERGRGGAAGMGGRRRR